MTDVLQWDDLLRPDGREGDRRWARLVVGPEAKVEERVRDLAERPPVGGADVMIVRGGQSRSQADLFREWARSLGFPGWFGRNWDAFNDSFSDLVEREQRKEDAFREGQRADTVLVLVTCSPELLGDEPGESLRTLTDLLRSAAVGLRWEEKDRPRLAVLRVLFQCEAEQAEASKERLMRAGLDLHGESAVERSEGEAW